MATNVAKRLASLSKRLSTFDQVVVTTAGKIISDAVIQQAQRDTHGGRMSNVSRAGMTLDVQITPLSNPTGVRIRPKGKQAGPWAMLSSGTSAHTIAARSGRKHRSKVSPNSSRARAMSIGGTWRVGPYRVRGSRGKQTWQRGRDEGMAKAATAVADEFRKLVTD